MHGGLVTEQKGMDDLGAALAPPALAGSDWRITIAGSGRIEHYAAMCASLGIAPRVSFASWVEEPAARRLLEAADLLVLPSHFACMPMAIIEAMSYGLAVVATEVGAVGEVVATARPAFWRRRTIPPG
jgi:glycosyltransferase involved in cell wall biosynthesis